MTPYDDLKALRLLTTASLADCRRALEAAGGDVPAAAAAIRASQVAELARATGAPPAACEAALARADWISHRAALELAHAYPPPEPPPVIAPESEARILAVLEGYEPGGSLESAEELHYCAWNYNWDDGLAMLWQIIAHPLCDWGTALLIYWRADPGWLHDPRPSRTAALLEETGVHALLREIEAKLLRGHFTPTIAFDPTNDAGQNLVLEYDGPPAPATVPAPLREPSPGRVLPWWSA